MGINATDKNRSLFLKGFNLSRSGANEDPTYLGFKFVFDFGALPIDPEYGWAPSPLLKVDNYNETSMMPRNLFGQPQYDFSNSGVLYYSAYNYLLQRDGSFSLSNSLKRANALRQFQILLQDINNNSPWFFQSIEGLSTLDKINHTGFQDELGQDGFNSARTAGKTLTINCLESLNLRLTALANLYNQATFDADNMRWLVPRNLRKFTMWIYVTEIRNFFKTTRLSGASTVVAGLDDLSSVLSTNRNPGNSLANTPEGERQPLGTNAPGNAFNSFARQVFSDSGLSNEVDSFRNQQDQSGIKPVLIYECQQCEFDFSSSNPWTTTIDVGTSQPSEATQSFKIHVGKVRMKTQFPNIRTDGNYLVLSDGYDQNRSSVQIYEDTLSLETIRSLGRELLTNVTSQAISDLINEGINQFVNPALSGVGQTLLGNVYSFNPSQLASFVSGAGNFANAQNFLNGATDVGLDNLLKGNLPTPQKVGLGGPPERIYTPPKADVYPDVPGGDLGVPDRVYPAPGGDVYPDVPGGDLGVPDRVYPAPGGDVYPDVPGGDLGVPDRVYPAPGGDVYPSVPGGDLGVPDRVYPAPGGDVYLGTGIRSSKIEESRVYPDPVSDFIMDKNIGSVYNPEALILSRNELRSPSNTFDTPPASIYPNLASNLRRGDIGNVYPPTLEDFILGPSISLGNTKGEDKFNISLGTVNGPVPDGNDFFIGNEFNGVIIPK